MAKITVGRQNSDDIEIYYEDPRHRAAGRADPRLPAERAFVGEAGTRPSAGRVPGHNLPDRRGFGNPASHHRVDYDTFAADLHALVSYLDLTAMVLAGFSMGTGEVTRYLGTYGSSRVAKAVLMGAIPPFLLKTSDNPDGVDQSVFDPASRPRSSRTGPPTQGLPGQLLQRRRAAPGPDQRSGLAE